MPTRPLAGGVNPLTLREIDDPEALQDTGRVYTNDVGGRTELMYRDDTGAEIQISSGGALNVPAATFLNLTDTPASYATFGLQLVRVNAGETALEFLDRTTDFLVQYALLAGRAGGQILRGGLLATENLNLRANALGTGAGEIKLQAGSSNLDVLRVISTGTGGRVVIRAENAGERPLILDSAANPTNNQTTLLFTDNGEFVFALGYSKTASAIISGGGVGVHVRNFSAQPWKWALDGTDAVDMSWSVAANVLTLETGTSMAWEQKAATTMDFFTAGSIRQRILTTGEVLIGRTTLLGTQFMTIEKNQNANTTVAIENSNAGTLAQGAFAIAVARSDATRSTSFFQTGTGFTPSLGRLANEGGLFTSDGASTIALITNGATAIRFATATLERARILGTGELAYGRTTLLNAFDIANFEKDQNNFTTVRVLNNTGGTASGSQFAVTQENAGAQVLATLSVFSASFTTAGNAVAGEAQVIGSGSSLTGLAVRAVGAVPLRLITADVERARILAASNTLQGNAGLEIQGGSGVHTLTLVGGAGVASTLKLGKATTDLIGLYGVAAVAQAAKINDPAGGATVDAEARTAINAIIDAMEGIGISASV